MSNRDPESPEMQKALNIANIAQLRISKNRNLWVWQLKESAMEHFDHLQEAKLFFMITDAWLLDFDHLEDADIIVLDVKNMTLKMLTKFNLAVERKLSKYQQDAVPIRIKQVHIVNAPSFIDKVFSLVKPLLKKEITEMIHFHSPDTETLYKYLNKEDLPEDYGGNLPAMDKLNKNIQEMITRHREYVIKSDLWLAEKKKKDEPEESIATFRYLDID